MKYKDQEVLRYAFNNYNDRVVYAKRHCQDDWCPRCRVDEVEGITCINTKYPAQQNHLIDNRLNETLIELSMPGTEQVGP